MRVVTFIFALMLVAGLSFGVASFVGTQAALADHHEKNDYDEIPGGEMEDAADGNTGASDAPAVEDTAESEMPGGKMKGKMKGGMKDAAYGNTEDADAPAAEDTTEGEMPGGEMEDDAAK